MEIFRYKSRPAKQEKLSVELDKLGNELHFVLDLPFTVADSREV